MICPQVQLLHRCALPIGVPFFTFSLLMTLLSNRTCRRLWPGNKRLRNVRCPCPLDDLSSHSRQDSNLRHPRDRRSIRYLHHRPRWLLMRSKLSCTMNQDRGTSENGLSLYPLSYQNLHSGRDSNSRPKYPFSTPPVRVDVVAGSQ